MQRMALLESANETHERRQESMQSEACTGGARENTNNNDDDNEATRKEFEKCGREQRQQQQQQQQSDCDAPDNQRTICNESQRTTTFATNLLSLIGHLLVAIGRQLAWLLIELACQVLFTPCSDDDLEGVDGCHQEDDALAGKENVTQRQKRQRATAETKRELLCNKGSSSSKQLVNRSTSSISSGSKFIGGDESGISASVSGPGESCHHQTAASQKMINCAQAVQVRIDGPVPASLSSPTAEVITSMDQKSAIRTREGLDRIATPTRVVACFEHQTVANELSAQVIEQALEAICQLQQEDTNMAASAAACVDSVVDIRSSDNKLPEDATDAKHESLELEPKQLETIEESSEPITMQDPQQQEVQQEQQEHQVLLGPEMPDGQQECSVSPQPASSGLSTSSALSSTCTSESDRQQAEPEQTSGGELDNLLHDESISSVSVSSYDDFCGQQASEINLRQLKMNALEDVLVCGQNRHSTESARRLFHMLTSSSSAATQGHQHQQRRQQSARGKGVASNRKLKASSLSSRSSRADDDDDDDQYYDDDDQDGDDTDKRDNNNSLYDDIYAPQDGAGDNYGTIKIIRRQCCDSSNSNWSSSAGSSANSGNFGRTLVCSVSPTSQLARSASSTSSSTSSSARVDIGDNKWQHQQPTQQAYDDQDYLSGYAIDGEEIRQCRAAFRENRRLIEQVQAIAVQRIEEQQHSTSNEGTTTTTNTPGLSRSSSSATLQSRLTDRPRWTDSLNRRDRLPNCSHCQKKLYPVDRMELDFTRATLNIHRNCFKCHVCSTLLRLETYASIDTKLYCPAHTKSATIITTQPQLAPTTTLTVGGQ